MRLTVITLCILCGLAQGQSKSSKRRIKSAKCKYTFVVNEFGGENCPNVTPQQQADALPQKSYRESPLLQRSALHNMPLRNSSELTSWLTNMEKQLVEELRKSIDINTTLSQHQNTLSKTEKLLTEYESNFTSIFRMLRYLESSIQDQTMMSANLDKKLSGVMLDMAEVNTVLTKKVAKKDDGNVQRKFIEVQSATQTFSCSKSPESIVYRG